MIRGVIKICLFTGVLLGLAWSLIVFTPSVWIHEWLIAMLIFMAVVHILIHVVTEVVHGLVEIEYHLLLLAGVAIRLFVTLFGLVFLSVFGIPDTRVFALNFSVVYLSFLVFEITTVLSNLRPNSSRERL